MNIGALIAISILPCAFLCAFIFWAKPAQLPSIEALLMQLIRAIMENL
jgi:hypothetical protein